MVATLISSACKMRSEYRTSDLGSYRWFDRLMILIMMAIMLVPLLKGRRGTLTRCSPAPLLCCGTGSSFSFTHLPTISSATRSASDFSPSSAMSASYFPPYPAPFLFGFSSFSYSLGFRLSSFCCSGCSLGIFSTVAIVCFITAISI